MNDNTCLNESQYPIDDLFCWGKVTEMDDPKTGGQMLEYLKARFETEELQAISHAAHISRTTLDSWAANPDAGMRKIGRDHYRRISSSLPAPDLAAVIAEVRAVGASVDNLHSLILSIRDDSEERARKVIGVKRKAGGGAA